MFGGQQAKPTHLRLMIIMESSNTPIQTLNMPLCNFSVIQITNIWMQQQFFKISRFVDWKQPGFQVAENSQKTWVSGSGRPGLEILHLLL